MLWGFGVLEISLKLMLCHSTVLTLGIVCVRCIIHAIPNYIINAFFFDISSSNFDGSSHCFRVSSACIMYPWKFDIMLPHVANSCCQQFRSVGFRILICESLQISLKNNTKKEFSVSGSNNASLTVKINQNVKI